MMKSSLILIFSSHLSYLPKSLFVVVVVVVVVVIITLLLFSNRSMSICPDKEWIITNDKRSCQFFHSSYIDITFLITG